MALDLEDHVLSFEREASAEYMDLVVGLMSQRSWSQSHHSNSLPDMMCAMFAASAAEAEAGMLNARQLWRSVLAAVRVSMSAESTAALKACLRDVFWKDHPFVKDMSILLDRAEWSYADPDARDLLWGYAGTLIDTKAPNENVFNTLRDRQRSNKNKRMNRHRAWHIANTSPFLTAGGGGNGEGFRHFVLPDSDLNLPLDVSLHSVGEGVFTPGGHKVHASIDSKSLLVSEQETRPVPWQPSGPTADHRQTAAAALLNFDAPTFRLDCIQNGSNYNVSDKGFSSVFRLGLQASGPARPCPHRLPLSPLWTSVEFPCATFVGLGGARAA